MAKPVQTVPIKLPYSKSQTPIPQYQRKMKSWKQIWIILKNSYCSVACSWASSFLPGAPPAYSCSGSAASKSLRIRSRKSPSMRTRYTEESPGRRFRKSRKLIRCTTFYFWMPKNKEGPPLTQTQPLPPRAPSTLTKNPKISKIIQY